MNFLNLIVVVTICSCLFSISSSEIADAVVTAQQYVEEGDIAFGSGEVKNSLAFYRAAVRLNPDNSNFWIKLGTAEYNLNQFEKAKGRFEKVLLLDDKSTTAKYYLKQLEAKLKKNDVCFDDTCDSSADNDDISDVVSLSISEFSGLFTLDDSGVYNIVGFNELSKSPFIVRQAQSHMNWNVAPFTLDNLKSEYGSNVVDFYPQNMLTRPEKTFNVPLSESIDFLAFPEGAYLAVDISEPGTYIQWNLNSTQWKQLQDVGNVNLAPYFVNNLELFFVQQYHILFTEENSKLLQELINYFEIRTHWNMLLIGEKGSGMFKHQDALPVGSWQAQLSGSKYFKICTPTKAFKDSEPPVENEVGHCFEGVSNAGDFLYYPPHYHHATLNTAGPSIALSGTLILENYRQEFADLLKRECGPLKEKNYDFTKEFCDFILHYNNSQ